MPRADQLRVHSGGLQRHVGGGVHLLHQPLPGVWVVFGRTHLLDLRHAKLDSVEQDTGYDDHVRLLHQPPLVADAVHARQHGGPSVQSRRADLLHCVPALRAYHVLVVAGLHHGLHIAAAEAHLRGREAAVHAQGVPAQEQGVRRSEQDHLELPEAAPLQPDDEVVQGADRGAEASATSLGGPAAPGAVQPLHHPRALLLPLCRLQQRGPHRAVQPRHTREEVDLWRGSLHHRQGRQRDVLHCLWIPELRACVRRVQPAPRAWRLDLRVCPLGEVDARRAADREHLLRDHRT
mmetsp:Transcript_56688/g.151820  ORF Transcript_56688/g.151820 Transcript_56688/m.151820 type:complete len:292 (+) Transcript_56688:459-1334(+)